ncbi:MAG: hypothetical protein HY719_15465 [Planctomycetes bacterium]|nr:hypothetical protein [Planctomycetota bacterium]
MPASKAMTPRRLALFAVGAALVAFAKATPATAALGAALCVAGETLRLWACGHLEKNDEVTNSGPYAHVKNPLYLGSLLIATGLAVSAANAAAVLLVAGVFGLYYFPYKLKVESDRMRRRFGADYDHYDRAVPALLPAWRRYERARAKKWSVRLMVQNSEIGAAAATLIGLLLVSRAALPLDRLGLNPPALAGAPWPWAAGADWPIYFDTVLALFAA